MTQEWLADHYAGADPGRDDTPERSFPAQLAAASRRDRSAPLDYAAVRIEEANNLLETGDRTIERIAAGSAM
jgi:hypothetical protein